MLSASADADPASHPDIPDDVDTVLVEDRDLEHSWGGEPITLAVPRTD